MPILTEKNHAGEHILSEGNGTISREEITVTGSAALEASAVLGKTVTGSAVSAADAGNTGDGAMGAITVNGDAKAGDYVLTFLEAAVDAGAFVVEDPDGENVGGGDAGTLFNGGGISFTLADGAADFVPGDRFVITVTVATEAYKEYDPSLSDGSQKAVAVLYAAVDATAADEKGVASVRDTEVIGASLKWKDAMSQADIDAGISSLAEQGIIVR